MALSHYGMYCLLCGRKVSTALWERVMFFWRPRGHMFRYKEIPLEEGYVRVVVVVLCDRDFDYHEKHEEISSTLIESKISNEYLQD